jgi:hypothetical protein
MKYKIEINRRRRALITLLARGYSIEEIAEILSLSFHTARREAQFIEKTEDEALMAFTVFAFRRENARRERELRKCAWELFSAAKTKTREKISILNFLSRLDSQSLINLKNAGIGKVALDGADAVFGGLGLNELRTIGEELLAPFAKKTLQNNPDAFMKLVLKYKVENFHERWLAFQSSRNRTLVLAPRGHGKTTILTVGYTLWRVCNNPLERVLLVSSTGMQAQGFLREIKSQIEKNAALRAIYGDLRGKRWTEREICIAGFDRPAKESSVTAVGVCGAIISRHYETIILDDAVDADSSRTQQSRERLAEWFYKVLEPCVEPNGRIHVIGTRYHPEDLYGRMIAGASNIEHLN